MPDGARGWRVPAPGRPAGLATSARLDGLLACASGRKFSVLITKFTRPEELFGPLSLTALNADRYVRVTAGKAAEAEFMYLDEVWKASSAVVNTLLHLLNERVFDARDGVARPVPLRLCVGSSDEWPDPEGGQFLAAAFGRAARQGATTASPPTPNEIERMLAVAPEYGIEIRVPGH